MNFEYCYFKDHYMTYLRTRKKVKQHLHLNMDFEVQMDQSICKRYTLFPAMYQVY